MVYAHKLAGMLYDNNYYFRMSEQKFRKMLPSAITCRYAQKWETGKTRSHIVGRRTWGLR